MIFREMTPEQGEAFYETHLRRDFPASELKSWAVMRQAYSRGKYDLLAAYEGDRLVGYSWQYVPRQGAILVDYLAIVPELRGRGYGTALLQALEAYYRPADRRLILESEYPGEAPDTALAQRRLDFYYRAGLVDSGVQTRLFGVRFCILTFGEMENPRRAIEEIYRDMLEGELYHQLFAIL